jgi:hypothetical protein
MTRFASLVQHLPHLRCGDRSRIQGTDHDVVGTLIVDPCLVVAEDPMIEAVEFASTLTNGPCSQVAQVDWLPAPKQIRRRL